MERQKDLKETSSNSANVAKDSDTDSDFAFAIEGDGEEELTALITSDDRTAVLDSAATKHLSPFKEDFVDLEPIEPKMFDTATKPFHAVARGTVYVELPNGHSTTTLKLENAVAIKRCSVASASSLEHSVQLADVPTRHPITIHRAPTDPMCLYGPHHMHSNLPEHPPYFRTPPGIRTYLRSPPLVHR